MTNIQSDGDAAREDFKLQETDKEKTKLRERQRRAITTKIFAGLRKHGGYNLPPRADINDVLRALAAEAGWVIEADGTTYRNRGPPPPNRHSSIHSRTAVAIASGLSMYPPASQGMTAHQTPLCDLTSISAPPPPLISPTTDTNSPRIRAKSVGCNSNSPQPDDVKASFLQDSLHSNVRRVKGNLLAGEAPIATKYPPVAGVGSGCLPSTMTSPSCNYGAVDVNSSAYTDFLRQSSTMYAPATAQGIGSMLTGMAGSFTSGLSSNMTNGMGGMSGGLVPNGLPGLPPNMQGFSGALDMTGGNSQIMIPHGFPYMPHESMEFPGGFLAGEVDVTTCGDNSPTGLLGVVQSDGSPAQVPTSRTGRAKAQRIT